MNFKHFVLPHLLFLTVSLAIAQTKIVTLEDIWGGKFRTEQMDVLHSMANGKEYSVLNFDRKNGTTTIDVYDYETSKKVNTLVDSKLLKNVGYFTDYTFSKNEEKLLLATNQEPIYRHSSTGVYYVFDVKTGKANLLVDKKIQEPTFSPTGNKVAYVFENNIYIKNLLTGTTVQVTKDGKKNKIINGITDWVYEEEFAFVRAFEWNSNGTQLAFLRFDETNVPEFSMDVYGKALYQTQTVFKYPKAGEANAIVTLQVYDLKNQKVSPVAVKKKYTDFYIPRIKWATAPNVLSAQYLNRHQNELDVWLINTKKNKANLVLAEKDDAYVDVTSDLTFLKDDSFIWTSEKDGFKHIYHYSKKGKLINQITKGNWEVTAYYGYDERTDRVYYQSVENGSINRDVYAVNLNGTAKTRLTQKTGTNNASFSADYTYFINSFSNAKTPPQYTLNNAKTGKIIKLIKDNSVLLEKLKGYTLSDKEFSTLNVNGNTLNMWFIKPKNFDASKQYPLFMYQYSGPGSQQVANRWNRANDYWFQYLAQNGYIVACIDGRGTGFKGAKFKKVTQKQLGKYEVEDQIAAAKQLGELPYIDASRIGIFGWSYGGFMSSNCLLKGNNVFKMAIAVAPVTSWRFYDSVYTERFMTTPQENASGYDDNSPIQHVDKLKGDFLLIHGSADDNVHVQNTMQMVEALIQANKPFEWAIYPDKNHSIYGGNTRLHLYTKMSNFIHKTLGNKN